LASIRVQFCCRFLAEKDVLAHGKVRNGGRLLMDHCNALVEGVVGRAEVDNFPVEKESASVGYINAAKDLHQSRLAGAMVSEQGVDRTCLYFEVNVPECLQFPERF
jgi:hypothetical protein